MKNFRVIFLLSILFLFADISQAQETFLKRIDVDLWTYPSQIVQLADGGFIITGFSSPDSLATTQNLYFMKTDESGNVLWTKTANVSIAPYQPDYHFTIGVTTTNDSGFALVIPIEPPSRSGFILVKFDLNGIKQWANQSDRSQNYSGMSIVKTANQGLAIGYSVENHYIYCTRFDSVGKIIWTNGILHNSQTYISPKIALCSDGCFLLGANNDTKFSPTGEVMWCVSDAQKINSLHQSMTKTSDGGCAVCGSKGDDQVFENFYVIKYDSNGKKLWDFVADVFNTSEGNAITEASNGNLVIAGLTSDTLDKFGLLTISKTGEPKQFKKMTLPGYNTNATAIIPTRDGGLALIGTMEAAGNGRLTGKVSALFMKIDSTLGGCHLSSGLYTISPGGGSIDTTYSKANNSFTDTAAPSLQFTDIPNVHEYDECLLSSVSDLQSGNSNSFTLSPNPLLSGKSVMIHIDENLQEGLYELSLIDLLGNVIKIEKINLSGMKQDVLFDVSHYPAGAYFVELRSQNNPDAVYRVKLIKEQ